MKIHLFLALTLVLVGIGNLSVQIQWKKQVIPISNDENKEITASIFLDVDGDDDMDICVARKKDFEYELFWLERIDGTDQFVQQPNMIISGYTVDRILAEDLDGDDDLDILVHSYQDAAWGGLPHISWYENLDGKGDYRLEGLLDIEGLETSENLKLMDIDNDTDLDLVFLTENSGIGWYENIDGKGNFDDFETLFNNKVADLVQEDIDSDGDLDLVIGGDSINWYENLDGKGTYKNQTQSISTNQLFENGNLLFEDIDGDVDKDLILSRTENDWTSDIHTYWERRDNKDFETGFDIDTEQAPTGKIFMADLDLDTKKDLIYLIDGDNDETKIVWQKNLGGEGEFSENEEVASFSEVDNWIVSSSLQMVDVDKDGDFDILPTDLKITNGELFWIENKQELLSVPGQELDTFEMTVYPLPVTTHLTINCNENLKKIEVSNEIGQKLQLPSENTKVDYSNLSQGLYLISLTNQLGQTITRKVIKE